MIVTSFKAEREETKEECSYAFQASLSKSQLKRHLITILNGKKDALFGKCTIKDTEMAASSEFPSTVS